jgi:hypothetical protein
VSVMLKVAVPKETVAGERRLGAHHVVWIGTRIRAIRIDDEPARNLDSNGALFISIHFANS